MWRNAVWFNKHFEEIGILMSSGMIVNITTKIYSRNYIIMLLVIATFWNWIMT